MTATATRRSLNPDHPLGNHIVMDHGHDEFSRGA
jgi:hypothetical protein